MPPRSLTEPVNTLLLDLVNPRFWLEDTKPADQLAAANLLIEKSALKYLMDDLAKDAHYTREPFIAYRREDGLVVVDGNKRLFASRMMTEPDFAEQFAGNGRLPPIPHVDESMAEALASVAVVEFDDWETAHRARVRRQAKSIFHWERIINAMDYRRMATVGVDITEIAECYRVNHSVVLRQIANLNLFEQITERHDERWASRYNFSLFSNAVAEENVRRRLGLNEARSYGIWERPLDQAGLKQADFLMTLLFGKTDGNNGKHRPPAVSGSRDLDNLARVYGSDEAMVRLSKWPNESVAQVCARMDGFTDSYQVSRTIEVIHSQATKELKLLKDRRRDLIPVPGAIHVSSVRHCQYHDGSTQYDVQLASGTPETHWKVPEILQKAIGFDCHVFLSVQGR